MINNLQWPDIFTGKITVAQRIAQGRTREHGLVALCADGLCAWGNCSAGAKPLPARFGEVMVEIGQAVGVSAYPPENLNKRAHELLGR
jgi:hypothetical protein